MIKKETWAALEKRMESLEIDEKDIIEKFILGSGSGGQKVNKTSSCVYLKHIPTGLEVKCQKERSRELNRYYARRELCEKFEEQVHKIESARQREIAKLRKQKQRRSRRAKEKILKEKSHHSAIKKMRAPPKDDS